MARPREPIDLIRYKGKKNLTEEEYEQRKAEEIIVPFTDIEPPEYLTEMQKEEFKYWAERLQPIGIFTELDVDVLAHYVINHKFWLKYTEMLTVALKEDPDDLNKVCKLQNLKVKAHKECRDCARDLGLTISSRARLVVPTAQGDGDDDDEGL